MKRNVCMPYPKTGLHPLQVLTTNSLDNTSLQKQMRNPSIEFALLSECTSGRCADTDTELVVIDELHCYII